MKGHRSVVKFIIEKFIRLVIFNKNPEIILKTDKKVKIVSNKNNPYDNQELINEDYPDIETEVNSLSYLSKIFPHGSFEILNKLMMVNCLYWACYYKLEERTIQSILDFNGNIYVNNLIK